MKNLKKALALLLAVAMIVSLTPVSLAAPGDDIDDDEQVFNFRNDTESEGVTVYYSVNGGALSIIGRGQTLPFDESDIDAIMFFVKIADGYTYTGITFTAGQQDGTSAELSNINNPTHGGHSFGDAVAAAKELGCTREFHYSQFYNIHAGNDGTRAFYISVSSIPVTQMTQITYYMNDGTQTSTVQPVHRNSNATLRGEGTFSRPGYRLLRWNTLANGTGTNYALGGTYRVRNNAVELYAVWEQVPYTLTINYVFSDGSTAAPTYTSNLAYGDTYNRESPTVVGYTPDKATVSGTMGEGNVTVTVTYTATPYDYVIHHVEWGTNTKIAEDTSKSGRLGSLINVGAAAKQIEGFTHRSNSRDYFRISSTIANNEATIYYTRNSHKLTINYVYADNTTAATTYTGTVKYDTTYSVDSPAITGYTPDIATVSGTMGDADITVTVTYTAKEHNLTINYVYADGSTAAPTYTGSVAYNATYSVASPAITGYTPDTATVSGTMGDADVTVTVTYAINTHTLTINYVYANGTTAKPTHTAKHAYGAGYNVPSEAITGYTPDRAAVSGTMGDADITVTVTYTANEHTLTIYYVYADRTEAAETHTATLDYGATYSVTSPVISNYTASDEVVTGTMGDENVEITVTYVGNLTAYTIHHYLLGTTTKLVEDTTDSAPYGSTIDVTAAQQTITGHTYSSSDPASLTIEAAANNVAIIYYTANTYGYTIKHIEKGTTTEIATATTGTAAYGKVIDVRAAQKVISGFSYNSNSGDITIAVDETTNVATIFYARLNLEYTIHYFSVTNLDGFHGGQRIAPSVKETAPFGSTVYVADNMIDIPGYTYFDSDGDIVIAQPSTNYTNETTLYYKPIQYGYTIKHVEKGTTNELALPTTGVAYVTNTITVANAAKTDIEGFSYDSDSGDITIAVDETTNVATIYYARNSYNYTVHHYLKGTTTELADDTTGSALFGAVIEVEPLKTDITGHHYDSISGDITIVETETGKTNEAIIYYAPNEHQLTIHYMQEDGISFVVQPSYTATLAYGATYSVASPEVTGHHLQKPEQATVTGKMPDADVQVIVIYLKNEYTLTINYVYADGKTAAETYTKEVLFSKPYDTVTSPTIDGYWADITEVPGGRMPANDVTVTVTYKQNFNITIRYVYKDGSPVVGTDTHPVTNPVSFKSVEPGRNYSIVSPWVVGYTPDIATVEGTVGTQDVDVTVTYSINSHNLTINYVYATGMEAAPTYRTTLDYNTPYSVDSPPISGFTPTAATVSGNMPDADVSVTVTYDRNHYNLLIYYVYEDGSTAAPTHFQMIDFEDAYDVASPAITGFTPDEAAISGTMPANNVEQTVTYARDQYSLLIHYVYEDGSEAAPDYTATVGYNLPYDVASPAITGFTPDEAAISGTMPTNNVEYTVTYARNDYNLLIHYVYADGSEAAPDHTDTIAFEGAYDVASPAITGFTPDEAAISGNMPAADLEYTVTYTANSYLLSYYVDGALTSRTTVVFGAPITPLAAPTLTGYTFSGWSAIPATMPADNVDVYGTFTAVPTPPTPPVTPPVTPPETPTDPTYVITWEMPDGDVLETDPAVPEGTVPTYDGAEPELEGSVFTGWSPEISPATGDVTYVAVFETVIDEPTTPLDPGTGGAAWALLNLILTIITGIVSAVMILAYFFGKRKKERDDGTEERSKKSLIARLVTLLPFVGSVIAFILTENMRNPMVFTDRWTILMVILAVVSGVTAFIAAKLNKTEDEEAEVK